SGPDACSVRDGMTSDEVFDSRQRTRRRSGSRRDTVKFDFRWKQGTQAIEHGMSGFTNGDDTKFCELAQVDSDFPAVQGTAFGTQLAIHCEGNIDSGESFVKDLPRDLLELGHEKEFALS